MVASSGSRHVAAVPTLFMALSAVAMIVCSGCSARNTADFAPNRHPTGPWFQVADAVSQPATAPREQLEDDGIASQSPPPSRVRREPDDPSQPFSPNYGRKAVPATDAAADKNNLIPDDLPAEFKKRLRMASAPQ